MVDRRSLDILFSTYWSSAGWKSAGRLDWIPETPPDDLEYAIAAGVMFPPRTVSHLQALTRVAELRSRIPPRRVGDAFVSTLKGKAPAFRSALGSLAVALHMLLHDHRPTDHTRRCSLCGGYDSARPLDLNLLSFERHKWGGVSHEDPAYIAFDLERLDDEAQGTPSATDHQALRPLLACCAAMEPGANLIDPISATKDVLPGGRDLRRTTLEILAHAGVLNIPGRSGFFESFTPAEAREDTPWHKDDWSYPIRWWRGGQGLNSDAIAFWFGETWPL